MERGVCAFSLTCRLGAAPFGRVGAPAPQHAAPVRAPEKTTALNLEARLVAELWAQTLNKSQDGLGTSDERGADSLPCFGLDTAVFRSPHTLSYRCFMSDLTDILRRMEALRNAELTPTRVHLSHWDWKAMQAEYREGAGPDMKRPPSGKVVFGVAVKLHPGIDGNFIAYVGGMEKVS